MEALEECRYKCKSSDWPPSRERQLEVLHRSAGKGSAERDTAHEEPNPEFS
jgi:hypothetical protein